MAKYIHVTSDTKTPENRGTSGTPFENHATNPNDGVTFGPTERTMFLPVEEPAQPTVNEVLQKVEATYTPDVDGKNVRGVYVGADEVWRFTWDVTDQELATARQIKQQQMDEEKAADIAAGYVVGSFVFPLEEEFFRTLGVRLDWLEKAIADGDIPAGSHLTFSDRQGKEVSVTASQLRTNYKAFGQSYMTVMEKEVRTKNAIETAATLAEVNAVTWSL